VSALAAKMKKRDADSQKKEKSAMDLEKSLSGEERKCQREDV